MGIGKYVATQRTMAACRLRLGIPPNNYGKVTFATATTGLQTVIQIPRKYNFSAHNQYHAGVGKHVATQ